jgi:acyl-coenzyme A thioesterase PaaI-like protein
LEQRGGPEFGDLVRALRLVQDRVAGTGAPAEVLTAATRTLEEAAALLAPHVAIDGDQYAGYRLDLPGRGHPLLAPFVFDVRQDDYVEGRVTLTRTHLSGAGRVHAGAIGLLFGEVLGLLSAAGGRAPSRNAALHVNYRAPTPSEVELRLSARVTKVEGRKVYVDGELCHGETLLVEAQGLYVRDRPAQD